MTAPHTRQSQVLPGSAGMSATLWAVLAADASAVVLKELDAAFEHFPSPSYQARSLLVPAQRPS